MYPEIRECRTAAGWVTQTGLPGQPTGGNNPADISDEFAPLRDADDKYPHGLEEKPRQAHIIMRYSTAVCIPTQCTRNHTRQPSVSSAQTSSYALPSSIVFIEDSSRDSRVMLWGLPNLWSIEAAYSTPHEFENLLLGRGSPP